MIIGVPKERNFHEHRVGLTPFAVAQLTRAGHTVVVERGAGEAANFLDGDYQAAGGTTVYSSEVAFGRADVVCRVGRLTPEEVGLIQSESAVCAFHHLAVAPTSLVEQLLELRATLVGYEIIRGMDGGLPVLTSFSEMAGLLAVQIAAHYLQNEYGGRGVLLGNIPGVAPPTVVILGAGAVGYAAARHAIAAGAHVIVLDRDLKKLRVLNRDFPNIVTILEGEDRLGRYASVADVLIGALLIPGARAPVAVTEDMVKSMKPGSVIVDVSIDQGGCVETSRPTTLDNPTFVTHGVVHYCVPNMTANIARTASRALAHGVLPYVLELANKGVLGAVRSDPGFAQGLYMYNGTLVNETVAEGLGLPVSPWHKLTEEGAG